MWVAWILAPGLYAAAEPGPVVLIRDGRVWDATPGLAGVHPGQRARDAQLSCPSLPLVTYEPGRHDVLLHAFWDDLAAAAPFVEPQAGRGHEAFAAWPGSRPGAEIAQLLRRRPEARVGLAANRLVARLACPKRPGLRTIEPGHERDAVADLPVTLLWTLDRRLVQRLLDLGLYSARDVVSLPDHALLAQLGADGYRARQAALGMDGVPVRACHPPRTLRAEQAWETGVTAGLPAALQATAERAAQGLRHGEGAGRLIVQADGEDGGAEAERCWARPQTGAGILARAAAALSGRLTAAGPVLRVVVCLSELAAVSLAAGDLFVRQRPRTPELPGVSRGLSLNRYEELARRFDPLLGGGDGAAH